MALDYHTIPGVSPCNYLIYQILKFTTNFLFYFIATSVDVERVFSQGRILLSHLKSRLSIQSTRALMCLGEWSRMGYVKDIDIKSVVMQPEVPAEEKEGDLIDGWDCI